MISESGAGCSSTVGSWPLVRGVSRRWEDSALPLVGLVVVDLLADEDSGRVLVRGLEADCRVEGLVWEVRGRSPVLGRAVPVRVADVVRLGGKSKSSVCRPEFPKHIMYFRTHERSRFESHWNVEYWIVRIRALRDFLPSRNSMRGHESTGNTSA